MWKGENNTDQQGRALLPPPKVVWGSQGSGELIELQTNPSIDLITN